MIITQIITQIIIILKPRNTNPNDYFSDSSVDYDEEEVYRNDELKIIFIWPLIRKGSLIYYMSP